ncbi:uncharacterized protein LOC126792936 [Argentina anserina]|uniref:uncharacterized protein LOC126792936 n=1 Tax=Argentina anserina TaxID=57926 RepID=UPI0021763F0D|nr:uncharacterized protein LOC126792936 [Potentilla anserina]
MMEVPGKKKLKPDPFTDTIFSWSLEDIFNEDLYKDKVKKIPECFQSAQHYFGSYIYPLLEETRAKVHSSMETLRRVPFAEVVGFEEAKPYGTNLYDVKVDYWRNRFSDSGKEPYKTLPGDLFVLTDAKPETVNDLQKVGRSWAFASATNVSESENEDDSTSLYLKVKASKEFEVENNRTSLFVVFLLNLIPEGRIWKALHMSRNLKIINEVLCTDSMGQRDFCSEEYNNIWNQSIVKSLSSRLNESQTGAVLACLKMLHSGENSAVELIWGPPGTGKTKTTVTLLSTLLQMNCRTLICAPTNVAITEVASRLVKMVGKAEPDDLFCSLGEILLFGNKERLKIGSDIEEIYMDCRVKRLVECLGPRTGWRHCFASMISLLEDCVSDYHIFLENELTKETEHNSVCEMKDKECRRGARVKKGKCKTFVKFLKDRFVSTATPLRYCISVFCTHIGKNYISVDTFQDLVSIIQLVDSFELLLSQDNVVSEVVEELFSHTDVEDVPESFVDNSFDLWMMRRDCLLALHSLRDSLSELKLPNIGNEELIREFCFQRATLIFCTASSSYKLHRVAMQPLSLVVIDEAAQLKECESTIPLQLPGVKHAVLVGDERQLPATLTSNVSDEAGFARSLFERLSLMGHSKHLLNMQYRMHPSISLFPNSNFYYNLILNAPNVKRRSHEKHYLPGSMFGPYSFINVIGGREEKDEDGHSRKNMVEVAIVSKILRNLYKGWIECKQRLSIGIVSPYAAQVVAIKDRVGEKYDKLDGFVVKVKTVDGFQGGEEDIIIISTVRSNSHQSLRFISKPERVNVSLTRARHCLWILGNERTLSDGESVWKALVLDAKCRQCFFNADEDKDLAKAILEVKKEFDQYDDLLNADSVLFRSARWKVLFSDNFLKSFKKLTSVRLRKSVLHLLLNLSSGWRPKKQNFETICGSSSMILKKFKVERLYIVCTNDIAKNLHYVQVLKIWDILPLEDIPKLIIRLDSIFNRYADDFINLCKEKCLDGELEVPKSWAPSLQFSRFKDLNTSEAQSDLVGDTSDCRSYVENSQVSESLLLMKFYSLSSGVVNHLLSDREGGELDLPFEVTDEEMEIILYRRSSFIVGRSGTGKTTVLTMKLFQKEQWHQFAVQGCYNGQNSSIVEQSSAATEGKVLRQLFVTVSPKLCFAIKRHVSHLKSFVCGGGNSADSSEGSLIDIDFDEETQCKDIQDSFHDIPPCSYPLVITFHKFLMMLDGTLSNSYFERFLDVAASADHFRSTRSVAFQSFIRTKEVNYERFSSLYWPHFNTQITKKLDVSRVFIEIISYIKGGLGAIDACDGKLSREDYVHLCEGRGSNLSKQKREAIYDVFQAYEKLKMENGEFDLADFVIDLHRRLKNEKYEGDRMEFVYIDEVQDLTMSQIALFKHMCNNVEEGFVFSGDTAQTIARGIDFRFQDIRHLFYKKFVLESRSNKNDERTEKGLISELLQLTQNFRTHAGILKLSQSIVELLYRFFPFSVDVLKPETSLIYGEAPVLLESGENENAIMKIFGNSGNIVGFGAEQVILVRDDGARQEISKFVGKNALVLTIVECKGLEFQDVLLYNFFSSSPLKKQWRVIYDYMKEQDLLDSTLPKGFPSFSESKHTILCSELKQLYVAVTRTRQRLWICENVEDLSKPMFDYWKKKCLVQQRKLDDSLAQAMQVASSPEEWKSRGIKLYHEQNYEMATMCFERAGDTYWERRSKASGLKAVAERMQSSNPEEAKSILREAAEIFDAIGKADSAARCFSDLGEYERAARIYLEKCGESELRRAAECFSLAGCYEDAADVYAKGNFFSECLTVCANGKLFEMGLQYINYWKQHAVEDCVKASRGEGIDKMEQEFLESCALHYHKLKDNRFMMKFVKAFNSVTLMRDFLKRLESFDELLSLEEEFGNFLEAAQIAQLKGEILLESDFLGKAGKFKEASLQILCYVLSKSLWSSGSKGWPMKKFPQQEELLTKAKSFAKNGKDNVCELVCTEAEILLKGQDDLAVLKQQMDASQRHKSIRGEVLSARKVLDAHLSPRTDKYIWEKELIGDLVKHSKDKISMNQVSIDSLVYYWNFWKENILHIIESVGCLETPVYNSYVELCFTCLGVWRLYHNMNPIYVLLIPDADWVRGVEKRHLKSYGKLVSIDVHQLIPAAQNYWGSELLSVGIKVLEKLEALFKYPPKNSGTTFFQCKALTLIYDVARYLLDSACLKPRNHYTSTLQKLVTFSTTQYVAYIFPLDWRNSLGQNMISLRRTDASKNVLNQVIADYASLKNELSYGQIGRIAMIILGSGKLNTELSSELVKKLEFHAPWKAFIENLCASIGPGSTSHEPIKLSVMQWLHEALVETYSANWGEIPDYISPGCFLYLVERLLFSASCFQGFVITTSSCFIEWLIYQDEDTSSRSIVTGGRPSLGRILPFLIEVVRGCIFNMQNMIEWIQKSDRNWRKYYQPLMLRLVTVLCLIHLNFNSCLDIIHELLGRNYITELLPWEFFDALRRRRKHNSLSLNVNVLAGALKKIDNTLVIASFGPDCSRFFCSDAIFVDMTVKQSKDDILRKWFPNPPVTQVGSVGAEGSGSCSVTAANDSKAGKGSKLHPPDSSLLKQTDVAAEKQHEAEDSPSKDEGDCPSKSSDQQSEHHDVKDSHTKGEEENNASSPTKGEEENNVSSPTKGEAENNASSKSNQTSQQGADTSITSSSKEAGTKSKNKPKGKNKKNKKKGGRK